MGLFYCLPAKPPIITPPRLFLLLLLLYYYHNRQSLGSVIIGGSAEKNKGNIHLTRVHILSIHTKNRQQN